MKIAVIENNILATNTIRRKLMEALQAKGHKVTILTTGTPEALQQAVDNGFNVVDIRASTQDPREIYRYIKNMYRSLKPLEADVCLTFTIRPAIWGNIVTRRLKIPTITNITGIGPLFERNNIAYRAARGMYKFALKDTKKIFFQNEDDMNLFLEKGFVNKTRAEKIPGSGIDYEYYTPAPATTNGEFIFLFISRLIKDKGILEFVEAARFIKSKHPSIIFRVLGPLWNQNLKDNLVTEKEIDAWQQEGVIEYAGEAKDVRPFIADASCLVLPSYREGTSNVLLEASSMGRPCITCDVTGCRDIVEHEVTGYLCKVKDPKDLAEKMLLMYSLDEQGRKEMGKKAREKVIREYDKKIVINAYLRAIEEVSTTSNTGKTLKEM
jgi:glycosyltransferase involved in cell wall biosynthesis